MNGEFDLIKACERFVINVCMQSIMVCKGMTSEMNVPKKTINFQVLLNRSSYS